MHDTIGALKQAIRELEAAGKVTDETPIDGRLAVLYRKDPPFSGCVTFSNATAFAEALALSGTPVPPNPWFPEGAVAVSLEGGKAMFIPAGAKIEPIPTPSHYEAALDLFLAQRREGVPTPPVGCSAEDWAYLQRTFKYHVPQGAQNDRFSRIRVVAHLFAQRIIEDCPKSRERSLALTNLEQSMFWANASVAREEPKETP
jgi:hypothetical protein